MLSGSNFEIKFLFSLIVPFFSEIEAALVFIGLRTILVLSPSGMTRKCENVQSGKHDGDISAKDFYFEASAY